MNIYSGIQRHELKYLILVSDIKRLINEFKVFMIPDPHAYKSPGYFISNLYFDSPKLVFYNNRKVGSNHRLKVRLRQYRPILNLCEIDPKNLPRQEKSNFLEVKIKEKDTINKIRIPLELEESEIINFVVHPTERLYNKISKTSQASDIERILFLIKKYQLKPFCYVQYFRQAYIDRRIKSCRVTFDTNVRAIKYAEIIPENQSILLNNQTRIIPIHKLIMEVKFNNQIPIWINNILRHNNLKTEKYSKYISSIDNILGRSYL